MPPKVRLRKAGVEAQGQVEDAGSQPCPVCEELFQNKWRDGYPAKASHLRQHAVNFIRNLLCLWICGMVVLKAGEVVEVTALQKTCVWKRFEALVACLRARGLAMTYSNVPICKLKKCGECHQVLSASDLKDHPCPGGGASSGPGAVAVPGGMPAAGLQGANQPPQAELHQQMLTLPLQCVELWQLPQSPLPQKRPGSTCSEHNVKRKKQSEQPAQRQAAGVEATPMPPPARPQCAAVGAAIDGWHLIGLGSDSGCLERGSCSDSLTEYTSPSPPPLLPPHPAQGRQLSYAASWRLEFPPQLEPPNHGTSHASGSYPCVPPLPPPLPPYGTTTQPPNLEHGLEYDSTWTVSQPQQHSLGLLPSMHLCRPGFSAASGSGPPQLLPGHSLPPTSHAMANTAGGHYALPPPPPMPLPPPHAPQYMLPPPQQHGPLHPYCHHEIQLIQHQNLQQQRFHQQQLLHNYYNQSNMQPQQLLHLQSVQGRCLGLK